MEIFGDMELKDILEAIKQGGTGRFGKTYKLNAQDFCIWIREYRKENKKIGKTNQIDRRPEFNPFKYE